MKKEQFKDFLENIKLEKDTWMTLSEIDSILLSDGRGIYPNWKHMRFKLFDDVIVIQHGDSEPYGTRLGSMFSISNDSKEISFPPSAVIADETYKFRYPIIGDILRVTKGKDQIIGEAMITNILAASNIFKITLSNPISFKGEFHLSFYDPLQYKAHSCMHGTEIEGIYMKFSANDGKTRKAGIFHEIIKVRDIKEIRLKLLKNKTYTVKEEKR